jgi:hypothetical protein
LETGKCNTLILKEKRKGEKQIQISPRARGRYWRVESGKGNMEAN